MDTQTDTSGVCSVTLLELTASCRPIADQPDFVLLFHDEESVSVDVEVSRVQQSSERNQADDLRADNRQLQVLNTNTLSVISTNKYQKFCSCSIDGR